MQLSLKSRQPTLKYFNSSKHSVIMFVTRKELTEKEDGPIIEKNKK